VISFPFQCAFEETTVPSSNLEPITIAVDDATPVSGLIQIPPHPQACYVLAHGAGAGMTHPFMAAMASGLAQRDIATLRFQFPYMENKRRRPDSPKLAQATVRAAVAAAHRVMPGLPLFAGGKSFGGRMTSQAQVADPLPAIRGLVFLGFPLHPADRPSQTRGQHLFDVRIPMLFLQGTRDKLAMLDHIEATCASLGHWATLKLFEHADHSFHVPARSGRNDAQVLSDVLDAAALWIAEVVSGKRMPP
jgi:uncharacterized protein